jgi:hypothetical protein
MGTFTRRGLVLGLLGVFLGSLAAFGPVPGLGPGKGESPEGIALALVVNLFEVSDVWGQGISGAPAPYRGRLVINYPLLNSILLILLLAAVWVAVRTLNRLFTRKLKAFENRIAYLEYTVKDLQARQKEDLDGLLRQIHNLPGKAKSDGSKKDLAKDTTVGKSPIPRESNPSADQ